MIQIVLLREYPKDHPVAKKRGKKYHRHPFGFPTGYSVSTVDSLFKNLGGILDQLRAKNPDNLVNVYYTVGVHSGVGGSEPVRDKDSYAYQTIMAFDIDYIDTARELEYLPVVAGVLGVDPQSLGFVSTGNGLHLIANLKTPIRSNKYLEETKPHYSEVVYKINTALKAKNLPGQGDPSIWDAPRILRLPESINEKMGVQKPCKLIYWPHPSVQLDLDIQKLSGLDALALANITPDQLKKNYPRPDFPHVVSNCEFMKWVKENPGQVHEPQFMRLLGLLAAMNPGDKCEYRGKELTPKEFAEAIHTAASADGSASQSLQSTDFETKWEHGSRYGAPKCKTVGQEWIGGCERCPHFGKINTPLALKSQEHISSEENGYWEMGKNGPVDLHYSDLTRVYRNKFSYVSCEPDRIFTFEQTHYKPTGKLTVKNWVDSTVGYEEKLRDRHCEEFVKKILRSGAIPVVQEQELFEKTIRGKLNCRNGVVNIITGELLGHAPALGFRYVLPYDFLRGEVSEMFLDWLAEVMENRTELMDAMLDLMAYCLWPAYDDHVFGYLIGEGSNGKSTILRIMQELLGKDNYSVISLAQLGGNRFAPANLEGKLANISEESSGSDLSFEELNVIKDLSAGGEIQVEHKGQRAFMLKNQAKLIFSANKPPKFHESGKAIRRRLLVIPFDHQITNPDENVAKALIAEVPKICSMLITRIQQNIRVNNGKFLVSRGGVTAAEAQDRILLAGNSVIEWGKVSLESSAHLPEEKYVACQEAYSRYSQWCQENNFKPVNSITFGHTMGHGVLTGAVTGSIVKKISGKPVRVYPRTQWKEEVIQ